MFIGCMFIIRIISNISNVIKNWPKYRCRPDIIILAPIYGFDTQENIEYCLKAGFDKRATKTVTPFYSFLGSFAGTLTTMLGSINSTKMTFATIVGSSWTVMNEFSNRIQALFYRIQYTGLRMKYMMGRMHGTMNAITLMSKGAMQAGLNFMNTDLWSTIQSFCFPPETPILVLKDGLPVHVRIDSVKIGDVLANNEKVTSTFVFYADGHDMVELLSPTGTGDGTVPPIQVSTNHFLLHNGKWIQAGEHPDAVPLGKWSGGMRRPLICLNTTTNSFQVGEYTFRDYDETSQGDEEAMMKVLKMLNGQSWEQSSPMKDSTMACHEDTQISLKDGMIPAKDIKLGMKLSHGTVIGLVKKLTGSFCEYKGCKFAPGTTVWCDTDMVYKRVSDVAPTQKLDVEETYISFVVSPSAVVETSNDVIFRDYMEIHDSSLELPYSSALQKEEARLEC